MSFITDSQVEGALNFMRDNAEELGRLNGRVKTLEPRLRIVKAMNMGTGTVSDKEAAAYASEAYRNAVIEGETDIAEYTALRALMDAAAMKVETWRSLNARDRRGNV